MKPITKAVLYLLLTTAIWGATFPLVRNAVVLVDPVLFVAVRFFLAALFLIPFIGRSIKNINYPLLWGGLFFGLFNCASYVFQTIGLQTTSSARGSFITGFSVILVPFIAPFLKLGRLRLQEIICSLICLVGLFVLTGAHLDKITTGDLWIFVSAITWAFSIAYLHYLSIKIKDHQALAFYQIVFTGFFAAAFVRHPQLSTLLLPNAIIGILFCAIVATSVVLYIQNKYQKFVSAPQAALIYSLEPVFASLFGFIINGEKIGWNIVWGGSLILLSLMLPSLVNVISHRRLG